MMLNLIMYESSALCPPKGGADGMLTRVRLGRFMGDHVIPTLHLQTGGDPFFFWFARKGYIIVGFV